MTRPSDIIPGTVEKYKPKRHHTAGIRHLLKHPFSGLLMQPGAGKTGITLHAFQLAKKHGHVNRLIVLAPLRACFLVWPEEVKKWGLPFKCVVLHGDHKDELLETEARDADILLLNYEGLEWFDRKLKEGKVPARGPTWFILDESTKVKHTSTKRFKLLRPLLPKFTRRTILTGTPAPNGLLDLFGQIFCVDLGRRLGQYITHYKRRFFFQTGYGGYTWVPIKGAAEEIQGLIRDVVLTLEDDDLDLPPYYPNIIKVELPKKARALYDEFEEDFIAKLEEGIVVASNAGVLSSKLRQVANGGVYDNAGKAIHLHDAKTEAIVDLIEEQAGNPLLVGYEYDHDRDRLMDGFDAPYVGGGVSPKKQIELLKAFNDGELPVLYCQSASVAHALNLQKHCHAIAWHSLTWNLEHYIQFIKRVHRPGQKHRVTVHHVVARDTVDERIMATLKSKDRTQANLLAGLRQHYLKRRAA